MATSIYKNNGGTLEHVGDLLEPGGSVGGAGCGGAISQEISANTVLTADSPRKVLFKATQINLTVTLPDATTLEADGMSFIFGCTGENAITVLDAAGYPVGADGGVLQAGNMRIYILVDKEKKLWMSAQWNGPLSTGGSGGTNVSPGIETSVIDSAHSLYLYRLEDNKLLIVASPTGGELVCFVGMVDDDVVTTGESVPIGGEDDCIVFSGAVVLSPVKAVVIAYTTSPDKQTFGFVLDISGSSVSVGDKQLLLDNVYSKGAVRISEDKFILSYATTGSNAGYMCCYVVTGSSLERKNTFTLMSGTTNIFTWHAVPLDEERFYASVSVAKSRTYYDYYGVFSISQNGEITGAVKSKTTEASDVNRSYPMSSDNFIAVRYTASGKQFSVFKCSVVDSEITETLVGTCTVPEKIDDLVLCALDQQRFVAVYCDSTVTFANYAVVMSLFDEVAIFGEPAKISTSSKVTTGNSQNIQANFAVVSPDKIAVPYRAYITYRGIINIFSVY